jgi:hypothetical protein
MQAKVISVLKPFLAFASSFWPCHVHNMLILILDLRFKNLELIKDYVDLELAMQVVANYDRDFNATFAHSLSCLNTKFNNYYIYYNYRGVFGSLAFTEKVVMELIRTQLSLFKRIIVPIDPLSPFA